MPKITINLMDEQLESLKLLHPGKTTTEIIYRALGLEPPQHGGKREGAGRKGGTMSYAVTVTYPKKSVGYTHYGAGSFSVAVCPTLERAREQRDWHKKKHAGLGGVYKISRPRKEIRERLDRMKSPSA